MTNIYILGDSWNSISTFIQLLKLKKRVVNNRIDKNATDIGNPSRFRKDELGDFDLDIIGGKVTEKFWTPSEDNNNDNHLGMSKSQGHMDLYEYNDDSNKSILFHTIILPEIGDSWVNLFEKTQIHGFIYLDESNGKGYILKFQISFEDWYDASYSSSGKKHSLPIVCFRMNKNTSTVNNNSDYRLSIAGPFLPKFLILGQDLESNKLLIIIKQVSLVI